MKRDFGSQRTHATIGFMLSLIALTAMYLRAYHMPHYSSGADSPDPGFNTWYWALTDYSAMFLPLVSSGLGVAGYRTVIGVVTILVSVGVVGWFLYDFPSWMPDF